MASIKLKLLKQSERHGGCMTKLKILNLYAGIGGKRKNWGKDHKTLGGENNN